MRLYLASFRIGGFAGRLLALSAGRRTALVPNALDGLPSDVRDAGLRRDIPDLGQVGLEVSEVDLRHPDAAERLSGYDIVWVRGGNLFVLRRVLADMGTDQVLADLIRGDAVVYGGVDRAGGGVGAHPPPSVGEQEINARTYPAGPGAAGLVAPVACPRA